MSLKKYHKKRDFKKTTEPKGKEESSDGRPIFVIQKHDASHLHWDFRIEHKGVLVSWAIPKEPKMNSKVKRLAIHVEDHPFEYAKFHGTIPKGQYGAGEVEIWDKGTYSYDDEQTRGETEFMIEKGIKKGHVKVTLNGKRLKGVFNLVNIDDRGAKSDAWLFFKSKEDKIATTGNEDAIKRVGKIIDFEKESKEVKKTSIPDDPRPMLATLTDSPFADPDYVFEIKFDGYRTLAKIDGKSTQLLSRNGKDLNKTFPSILESFKDFPHNAIFDGEVTVNDKHGVSNFELLREYISASNGNPVFNIFDITYFDGYDLTKTPLIERKRILKRVIPSTSNLLYVEDVKGEQGKDFFNASKEQHLEGIIGKKSNSNYAYGERVAFWKKVKTVQTAEVLIIGYEKKSSDTPVLSSLLLGAYDHEQLVYIGNVGTGFSEKNKKEILVKMKRYERKSTPLKKGIPKLNNITWLTPKLSAIVEFIEMTKDKKLRHPSFVELISSKKKPTLQTFDHSSLARSASTTDAGGLIIDRANTNHSDDDRDVKVGQHTLHLTNQSKIFWLKERLTKGDLVAYYQDVAEVILPYLKDRPISMHRNPNGAADQGFYQKDFEGYHPDWIKREKIYSKDTEEYINYVLCQEKATLIYLANLGCIELHPWHSRVGNLNHPDYVIFDLDPHGIGFEEVVEVALSIRDVCENAEIPNFVKTSGIAGLHIYMPIKPIYTYIQAHQFIDVLAHIIHEKHPDTTSLERNPDKRKNKIYLDIGQNRKGQTIVAPYALRPINGAPVSAPLKWKEVNKNLNPQMITMRDVRKRIDRLGDLWAGMQKKSIKIEKVLEKLEEMLETKL